MDYFAHFRLIYRGQLSGAYRGAELNSYPGLSGRCPARSNQAALARAAGLSMVAYDTNGLQNQFLQGWLTQDRYLMKTPFGAPTSSCSWANPVSTRTEPSSSSAGVRLLNSGSVFRPLGAGTKMLIGSGHKRARPSWFHQGNATVVSLGAAGSSAPKPLRLGDASVIFGRVPFQFSMDDGGTILVIGLKPGQKYLVETDDEEMREVSTDRAGTFVLQYPAGRVAGVRVHEDVPFPLQVEKAFSQ